MLNLLSQVQAFEPFYASPEPVSPGRCLIGYGRNTKVKPVPYSINRNFYHHPMTYSEAEYLLVEDLYSVINHLNEYICLSQFNEVRQQAIIHLAYWLTVPSLLKAEKLLAALDKHDFDMAAAYISRLHPGERAEVIAVEILHGEYYE
ncbi:glycoside hydrolase family protein [Pseudoalteromonas ruthenica]|uniref:glycoside hydrolase family protein n=1 Tax=Pseudoalteromonas ruthenica TaxID=151081 RepID=UPI00110AC826|nr:hypothetical protein [Pseudoalteromonas ruthenica]TMP23766.1 hypothetical protein CWC06_09435 [Pseudoalteromonas ruthenica]